MSTLTPEESSFRDEISALLEEQGTQWRAREARIQYHLSEAVRLAVNHYPNRRELILDLQNLINEVNPDPPSTPAKKIPIPYSLRRAVFERDAYRCCGCGSWKQLAVDHIYPESRGGMPVMENLQTLCKSCNSKKGTKA
jgi:5-methylcytosine-specific restriction endonuclease McrA